MPKVTSDGTGWMCRGIERLHISEAAAWPMKGPMPHFRSAVERLIVERVGSNDGLLEAAA